MGELKLRVISDIHLHHAGSHVRDLASLRPLLAEAPTIWNGDSVEAHREHDRPVDRERADAVRAFVAAQASPPVLLTGNHDPAISDTHEVLLGGTTPRDAVVWITHGDVLYDEIVPWGRNRQYFAQRLAQRVNNRTPIDERYRALREACITIEPRERSGSVLMGFLRRIAEVTFPPTRAWRMWRAWTSAPLRACDLAAQQRPDVRLVVIGHTHWPGVWRTRRGTWVVNTGSYGPPFGPLLVDLTTDGAQVRRVRCDRGEWRPGRVIREIPLDLPPGIYRS